MFASRFIGKSVLSKSNAAVNFGRSFSNLSHESATNASQLAEQYNQHVKEATSRWIKNDEVYFGKERDLANFPTIKYSPIHPKVRLGFIPDSWFHILYPKTGVTGPYLLLFGSVAYLLSKEIWVVDPHFVEVVFSAGMATALIKKFGPMAREYLDKKGKEAEYISYLKPLEALNDNLDRTITTAEQEISKTTTLPALIDAKVENLHLQLEAAYRDRLQQVHRAVRRRLDYHVERENTTQRFHQEHMINWVMDRVVKGITPAQEKENIVQCITELKRLSNAASPVA